MSTQLKEKINISVDNIETLTDVDLADLCNITEQAIKALIACSVILQRSAKSTSVSVSILSTEILIFSFSCVDILHTPINSFSKFNPWEELFSG